MQAFIAGVLDEIFGIAGGALFLGSWMLQAYESKRAQQPIVSVTFFWIRAAGCVLLAIESLRSGSWSLFVVTGGTLLLNLYNIVLFRKNAAQAKESDD